MLKNKKKLKTKNVSEEEKAYIDFLKDFEIDRNVVDKTVSEYRQYSFKEEFYSKITDLEYE